MVVSREALADVAADVAKVAAAIEIRAEQVEEKIRPEGEEVAEDRAKHGDVGVPSLEDLANTGHEAREEIAGALDETKDEADERKDRIWSKLHDESPERLKERMLLRIQQASNTLEPSPPVLTFHGRSSNKHNPIHNTQQHSPPFSNYSRNTLKSSSILHLLSTKPHKLLLPTPTPLLKCNRFSTWILTYPAHSVTPRQYLNGSPGMGLIS